MDGRKFVARYLLEQDCFQDYILSYNQEGNLDCGFAVPSLKALKYWMPWNPPQVPEKKHYCSIKINGKLMREEALSLMCEEIICLKERLK
jgi:hypothetical protein